MIRMDPVSMDPVVLRQAFSCFPSGVTAVCAMIGDTPVGMAASSFTSVSVDPPLVSVCVQDTSATWPRLRSLPRLGLSVLAEEHDTACLTLSKKVGDRFDGVEWERSASGAVFVHSSAVWLECSLYRELPAGDHGIALLEIDALRADPDTPPLVFHRSRFRRLAS
ncbi:flavin reductase family protein [Nocardia jiangxiensis]|uniref:flavin reductase family protein n=1 Tax=Nocardia jiangxiensis TaxID=282685 RepID=UPI0002F7112D|nr:flavin reductase family protein [Nocardia jiangxiensis]